VRVQGEGAVRVPGYGLADAEHQVEKELRELWPEASIQILDVGRDGSAPRIVEDFAVRYRVKGEVDIEADDLEEARREAFRQLRTRFTGSRFSTVAWTAI
jgi:hypothetical protein